MKLTRIPFTGMTGKIYRSPMPFGGYDPDGAVWQEMRDSNIDAVVMLAPEAEARQKSGKDLIARYQQGGYEVIYCPIADYEVPDRKALSGAIDRALSLAQQGKNVMVHCHAGIGRTGLFMVEMAKKAMQMPPQEAYDWVRRYIKDAVETPEQKDFLFEE